MSIPHGWCSVHDLVTTQTFSIAEAEFLVRHAEKFSVCNSCKAHFENQIRKAQQDAQRKKPND